ncbi:hypothetical protein BJX66DRAFT_296624 [Aspergillus keveii]|uniref:Zn(2)-C6 fungal-type domain-containing protein n=1 Tax=Aspergillus keveii TaxID=714993 RepID=A0ABR4GFP2_9EURO
MAGSELAVPRALSACISCATGRRKCDRLLPSCSRCSRPGSSRPCAYNECSLPSASGRQGVRGLTAETTPPPLGRGPGACVRCRTVKRRCDRGLPSCSRCEKSGVSCAYAADAGAPLALQSWTALPMNMQGYLNSASGGSNIYETYYGLLDCARTLALPQSNISPRVLLGPALNVDFPVPDSDNVPELLYYFCSILPTAAALPNSLSIYVHTEWLRRAVANPCLLHSTLFCASAYLDSRQNANSPSSRTMFHHLQAVKIIREQLAQPNFQPSYEIAAAVLALSYFTMTSNDIESALVHIQGLARILHISQNEGPDFKYLTALFSETLICFAVCLDRDITSIVSSSFTDSTVLPLLLLPKIRPSSLLRRILAQSADDANSNNNRTGYKKHWPPTSYVMLEIQKVYDIINQGESPSSAPFPEEEPVHAQQQQRQQLNTVGSLLPEIPWISAYEDTTMEKATTCCYLTVRVFWGIVNNNSTESSTTGTQGGQAMTASSPHHAAFETLKETLSKIDPIPWVQCAPELYAWVYFTAAAACDRDEDRKEIMIAAMRYLTGLNGVDLSLIREGWHYFRWLRGTRTRTLGI